jgi:hypothetical protein
MVTADAQQGDWPFLCLFFFAKDTVTATLYLDILEFSMAQVADLQPTILFQHCVALSYLSLLVRFPG